MVWPKVKKVARSHLFHARTTTLAEAIPGLGRPPRTLNGGGPDPFPRSLGPSPAGGWSTLRCEVDTTWCACLCLRWARWVVPKTPHRPLHATHSPWCHALVLRSGKVAEAQVEREAAITRAARAAAGASVVGRAPIGGGRLLSFLKKNSEGCIKSYALGESIGEFVKEWGEVSKGPKWAKVCHSEPNGVRGPNLSVGLSLRGVRVPLRSPIMTVESHDASTSVSLPCMRAFARP